MQTFSNNYTLLLALVYMKILVRLPNWLGDVVMSTAFMHALHEEYPTAEISVIIKKGLHEPVDFFPFIHQVYLFDKEQYKGIYSKWKFGRSIAMQHKFDMFFCLPDSFSSAFIGYAAKAGKRIGFAAQARSFLLTKAYKKPKDLHRTEEYVYLLEKFTGKKIEPVVRFNVPSNKREGIVVNINSEASSRRWPVDKATSLIDTLAQATHEKIYLVGAPKEAEFVKNVFVRLAYKHRGANIAGQTNLPQLIQLISNAKAMLSSDSGPAHIANACNTPLVVLFGAGNENKTAPYNKNNLSVMRLGELPCEPCEKNVCKFGVPLCLMKLNEDKIVHEVKRLIGSDE